MKAVRQTGRQRETMDVRQTERNVEHVLAGRRTDNTAGKQRCRQRGKQRVGSKESGTQTGRFKYVCVTDLFNIEAARESNRQTHRMYFPMNLRQPVS